MKIKYYYIGIILLLFGIFIFFYQTDTTKKCDKNFTKSIVLLEEPYYIQIVNDDDIYINIIINNINKKYISSSVIKNYFRNVSPLCSNTVYKINLDYFKNTVCFKGDTYEICRGEKLQKGYPVAIKQQETLSDLMYIVDSYPWDSIESTLQQIKSLKNSEELFIEQFTKLIDRRIITLPERSSVSIVKFKFDLKDYRLQKIKKNQWLFNEVEIPPHIASSFINAILMLEEEIVLNNILDVNLMETILDIEIGLDFEEFKFSLFRDKFYNIKFYQLRQNNELEYYIGFNKDLKKIKKEKFIQLEQNIKALIKSIEKKAK